MRRPTYVYRLEVIIPPERRWPWTPPGFHDDHWPGCSPDTCEFQWPTRRLFLSQSAATRRAKQMREWGATVTIHRSERVVWHEVQRDQETGPQTAQEPPAGPAAPVTQPSP